jgi:hypothetical protein
MKQFRYKVTGQSIFIQPSDALPFTLVMPAGFTKIRAGQEPGSSKTALQAKTKEKQLGPLTEMKKA